MSYWLTARYEKLEWRKTSSLYTTMEGRPHHLWLKWSFRQTVTIRLLLTQRVIFARLRICTWWTKDSVVHSEDKSTTRQYNYNLKFLLNVTLILNFHSWQDFHAGSVHGFHTWHGILTNHLTCNLLLKWWHTYSSHSIIEHSLYKK
jgi:heme exporter protein D